MSRRETNSTIATADGLVAAATYWAVVDQNTDLKAQVARLQAQLKRMNDKHLKTHLELIREREEHKASNKMIIRLRAERMLGHQGSQARSPL